MLVYQRVFSWKGLEFSKESNPRATGLTLDLGTSWDCWTGRFAQQYAEANGKWCPGGRIISFRVHKWNSHGL
jgi:hypothetical protein